MSIHPTLRLRAKLRMLLNRPAPAAGLQPLALNERLEALQIALHLPVQEAQRRARALDRTLRLIIERQQHARFVRVQVVERDHATIRSATNTAPRNLLIRNLLRNLRVPL